ncbi:MAG TPA: hypothetical protein VHZ78_11470 [Rhizomicrobium sp.]|nr:hypothetical protein [Rhizomicrobium sp.]
MSPEFVRVCKRLTLATAIAVLAPLGTAAVLGATQAAASDADTSPAVAPPAHSTASLDTLGRATAVSWVSTGHIARY